MAQPRGKTHPSGATERSQRQQRSGMVAAAALRQQTGLRSTQVLPMISDLHTVRPSHLAERPLEQGVLRCVTTPLALVAVQR